MISFSKEDMAVGGGLFDDGDVTIVSARWGTFDYQGKTAPVTALNIVYQPDDPEQEKFAEHYTSGASFYPINDGLQLDLVAGAKTSRLNLSSSAGFFLAQLQAKGDGPVKGVKGAGYPDISKVAEDVSVLDGLRCHVRRLPKPTQSKKDAQLLCITSLNEGAGPAETIDPTILHGIVTSALVAGPINKSQVKAAIFTGLQKTEGLTAEQRTTYLNHAARPDFLTEDGAPWTFDGTTVTAK